MLQNTSFTYYLIYTMLADIEIIMVLLLLTAPHIFFCNTNRIFTGNLML